MTLLKSSIYHSNDYLTRYSVRKVRLFLAALCVVFLSGCEVIGLFSGNSILVVDLDAIAKATGRQELMQSELELANVRLTEQLKLVASQLEQSISLEKDKLSKSPSDEETKQLQTLVAQAQQQLVNSKNVAVQQSNVLRSNLILNFRKDVAAIAKEIAQRHGSKLVTVSSYETIWFDPKADITDEVIAVMRARGLDQTISATNDDATAQELAQ